MWAFSDESERPGVMLLAVVMLDPGDVEAARQNLRGLSLPGQRRVHTAKESPRRRKLFVDTVCRVEGLHAVVVRYRRPPGVDRPGARRLLLQAATGVVVGSGVSSWMLEDQEPAQRLRDRAAIAHALSGVDRRLHPVYDHRPPHDEPLLWAADAIGWAVGADGDWRRRLGDTTVVRDIHP